MNKTTLYAMVLTCVPATILFCIGMILLLVSLVIGGVYYYVFDMCCGLLFPFRSGMAVGFMTMAYSVFVFAIWKQIWFWVASLRNPILPGPAVGIADRVRNRALFWGILAFQCIVIIWSLYDDLHSIALKEVLDYFQHLLF